MNNPDAIPYLEFNRKKERLVADFLAAREQGGVGLGKSSSNLFRHRKQEVHKVNVRDFNRVLRVDTETMLADVEGMITYEDLVNETLKYDCLPTVVPELKTITIGGAISGIGIESSSFRYGFVHETVEEIEVMLASGETVIATPKNKYKDLFFGFANSYGCLGYILRLKVRLIRAAKYVRLEHTRYNDPVAFFGDIKKLVLANKKIKAGNFDYIDGSIHGPDEMYITIGRFTDDAPYVSDYTGNKIYYRSVQEREEDYLSAHDYIWRWDTDWFWCSRKFHVQKKWIRPLVPKKWLGSANYWKVMNFSRKYAILDTIDRVFFPKWTSQTVVQDVEIPIEGCVEFMDFFHREIGIKPVWACPITAHSSARKFDLYDMKPNKVYVNFGFWDVVSRKGKFEDGHFDRLIEQKVMALHGKKSLYSTAYYTEAEFWKLYNRKRYTALKKKYDPEGRLRDLYTKVVGRK